MSAAQIAMAKKRVFYNFRCRSEKVRCRTAFLHDILSKPLSYGFSHDPRKLTLSDIDNLKRHIKHLNVVTRNARHDVIQIMDFVFHKLLGFLFKNCLSVGRS